MTSSSPPLIGLLILATCCAIAFGAGVAVGLVLGLV